MPKEKNPEYFCDMCGQKCESNIELKDHKVFHEKGFLHQCCICKVRFKLKFHLLIHKTTHKESKCDSCYQMFPTTLHLLNHFKSDHVEDFQSIKCDLCEKEYETFDELFSHRASHFRIYKSPPIIPTYPRITATKKVFICDFCGKQSGEKKLHIIHCRIHTGEKPFHCEICSKKFRSETHRKSHMKVHRDTDYDCKLCSVSFKGKKSLLDHLDSHSALSPIGCDTCGKIYNSKHKLACHEGRHLGDKLKCDFCPLFFTRSSLKKHVSTHLDDKPHKCKFCPKAFAVSSYLKRHYLTHTGEKPYSCEVCSKAFSKCYNWKVHKRIHTGEKPYACEICKTTFRVKSILKEHYKTHRLERVLNDI